MRSSSFLLWQGTLASGETTGCMESKGPSRTESIAKAENAAAKPIVAPLCDASRPLLDAFLLGQVGETFCLAESFLQFCTYLLSVCLFVVFC